MIQAAFVIMGAGLVAYVLTAGADFGGGIWDLLASGPRSAQQRSAIEHELAPIWEVNHIWLIFVIVLMFTVFPVAFAAIGTALHLPILFALIGIVLRGAAFSFRAYGIQVSRARELWGRVFAWSSLIAPLFLGVTIAAVSSGAVRLDAGGNVRSGFLAGWLTPFAWSVGGFVLLLFALLAAVYLTVATEGEVCEDFRRRALVAEILAGGVSMLVLWRASVDAPQLFAQLVESPLAANVQVVTAAAAISAILLLLRRRYRLARVAVALQVTLVVLGWGLAMNGHLLLPDLPLAAAGARQEVLSVLFPALAGGALLLAPSLLYLFRVFRKSSARPPVVQKTHSAGGTTES